MTSGRNYYFDPNTLIPSIPVSISSIEKPVEQLSLCHELSDLNENQFYDLSSLICAQFASSKEYNTSRELLDILASCSPTSDCFPCTTIGARIASSLIKIAALRIFAEPEQSIIEIPVNSLDAYNPASKVGKFGMGFFSFLYWLIGHPKRYLDLYSFYEEGGKYCSYRCRIQEINGVLAFSLKIYPHSNVRQTGLLTLLDASGDNFTADQWQEFSTQLQKLKYTRSASIWVGRPRGGANPLRMEDISMENISRSSNRVHVTLSTQFLSSEDYATGLPISTLLKSLFVPSVSTKTIKLSDNDGDYANDSGYVDNGVGFYILVNRVAVYLKQHWGTSHGFILDLPSTMRVPVSRDDVILDNEGAVQIFRAALEKLLDSVLQYELANNADALSSLQFYLEAYSNETVNHTNRSIVRSVLQKFYDDYRGILAPSKYISLYTSLKPNTFAASETYDAFELTRTVDRIVKSDDTIWYGKKVVILNTPVDITDAGLYSYLFISSEYKLKLGAKWVETITVSYKGSTLYPYGTVLETSARKEHEQYAASYETTTFDKTFQGNVEDQLLYLNVMARYESLRTYFIFEPSAEPRYFAQNYMHNFYTPSSGRIMAEALLSRFDTFKGNSTYGHGRNKLLIITSAYGLKYGMDLSAYFANKAEKEKFDRFFIEHIRLSILSTEERTDTVLMFVGMLSPYVMLGDVDVKNKVVVEAGLPRCKTLAQLTLFLGGIVGLPPVASIHIPAIPMLIDGLMERIFDFDWTQKNLLTVYAYMNEKGLTYKGGPTAIKRLRNYAKQWYHQIAQTNLPVDPNIASLAVPKNRPTFTISHLIAYLFAHEAPSSPFELAADVQKTVLTPPPLQLTEIAVNEGTTKPFLEAIMTELVQNSVDAIREKKGPKKILLYLRVDEQKRYLSFSIVDFVGMSAKAFMYIAIPFLSTKTPSELVTGEMGSGFFNVYRESDFVRIDTKGEDGAFASSDIPIRDPKSGRVIDVQKTFSPGKNKTNGTVVEVRIPITSEEQIIDYSARVYYTASKVLGLIDIPLLYNDAPVTIDKLLITRMPNFEIYLGTNPEGTPSYLMTKGIPFAPLGSYISSYITNPRPYLETNVFINIRHGGYTPIQTRTKIRLSPKSEVEFSRTIFEAVYIASLSYLANKPDSDILPHMKSTAAATQLKFSLYGVPPKPTPSEIVRYYSFKGSPPIVVLLNHCIDIMRDEPYDAVKSAIDKYLKTVAIKETTVNELRNDVIRAWLKVKNKGVPVVTKITKIKVKAKVAEKVPPNLSSAIKTWISVYHRIAREVQIVGYDKDAPKLVLYSDEEDESTRGYYESGKNTININTIMWTKNEQLQLLTVFEKRNPLILDSTLQDNHVWSSWFRYSFPATTLSHEMEHYRRKNSHASGAHDVTYEPIYPGDMAGQRNFEQAANTVYEIVLKNGFYEKFFQSWTE